LGRVPRSSGGRTGEIPDQKNIAMAWTLTLRSRLPDAYGISSSTKSCARHRLRPFLAGPQRLRHRDPRIVATRSLLLHPTNPLSLLDNVFQSTELRQTQPRRARGVSQGGAPPIVPLTMRPCLTRGYRAPHFLVLLFDSLSQLSSHPAPCSRQFLSFSLLPPAVLTFSNSRVASLHRRRQMLANLE